MKRRQAKSRVRREGRKVKRFWVLVYHVQNVLDAQGGKWFRDPDMVDGKLYVTIPVKLFDKHEWVLLYNKDYGVALLRRTDLIKTLAFEDKFGRDRAHVLGLFEIHPVKDLALMVLLIRKHYKVLDLFTLAAMRRMPARELLDILGFRRYLGENKINFDVV